MLIDSLKMYNFNYCLVSFFKDFPANSDTFGDLFIYSSLFMHVTNLLLDFSGIRNVKI